MSINKDIPELLKAGVITKEIAHKIKEHYKKSTVESKPPPVSNYKLLVVFGILGAILVGLGVILIIAHNWDELSRATKTFLAFLPLILGQGLCLFTLLKKANSMAWVESCSTFLFLAVGACISMISQIYNISGDGSSFILTWVLLCLPICYIMKSSMASILYLIGINYFVSITGLLKNPHPKTYLFWPLLIAVFPYYYKLYKNYPIGNFAGLHNWIIPFSIFFGLNTILFKSSIEHFILIAYFGLSGLYYMIGNSSNFKDIKVKSNGPLVLGSAGTIILLFSLSFDRFWLDLLRESFDINEMIYEVSFYITVLIGLLNILIFTYRLKNRSVNKIRIAEIVFPLFIAIYIIGTFHITAVFLINILIFVIGILTVREGTKKDHLGVLNYGLLIICSLIICRFFDTDLSFVLRGILFVLIGLGFLIANYWMVKIKRNNG